MSKSKLNLRSFAAAAMFAAFALPCSAQITFDFNDQGLYPFADGPLQDQQGWTAEADWLVGDSAGAGNASTDVNTSIATYRTPVILQNPSDTFGYSINMQWDGTYTTPATFVYTFLSGLKLDDSNTSLGTNPANAADANIQFFSNANPADADQYRLLNGFSGLAGASNIGGSLDGTQLNPGDILQFDYEITLGSNETDTFYTARLQNLTDGTDTGVGTVTGVDASFHAALTSTGVFPFFQRHLPNPAAGPSGLTTLQINEISGGFGEPLAPEPPSPIFWQDDAPPSGTTTNSNSLVLTATTDPLDASNDVGLIELGAAATFLNVNNGGEVDVSAFEGQKFRAKFDYLVPTDTAFDVVENPDEPNQDTFWVQVGFRDPVSATTPQGAGNSDSAGFPRIDAVDDGTWRTIELIGTIPPGTAGATMSITLTDDGFQGGPADTFGNVMYIDNIVFEAIDRLPGDFNGDGVVDAVDYAVWRENLGALPPAPDGEGNYAYRDATNLDGEAAINHNGDGMNGVDMADFFVWRDNFGATAASLNSVSLLGSSVGVPEPSALALCVCGLLAASWRRRAASRREVV